MKNTLKEIFIILIAIAGIFLPFLLFILIFGVELGISIHALYLLAWFLLFNKIFLKGEIDG